MHICIAHKGREIIRTSNKGWHFGFSVSLYPFAAGGLCGGLITSVSLSTSQMMQMLIFFVTLYMSLYTF